MYVKKNRFSLSYAQRHGTDPSDLYFRHSNSHACELNGFLLLLAD